MLESTHRTPEAEKSRVQSSVLYIISIQEGVEIYLGDENSTKNKNIYAESNKEYSTH